MRALLVLALLLVLPAAAVQAEGEVDYGPLPDALATLEVPSNDQALAARALEAIATRADEAYGRALLGMLGDAGLKAVATRLAEGTLPPYEKEALVAVVSAATHPAADVLLARAAHESRPLYRILAAHGLGRGRTTDAVPVLATLARDAMPAVRIAALRSLFAHEDPAAKAARMAVPPDAWPTFRARRLAWHRRARDATPALLAMAREAYLDGRDATLRMAAADYLTLPELEAPIPILEMVMREMGGGPFAAWLVRHARGAAQQGYDAVRMRALAIQACFTLLEHADATEAQRARWLHWAVGWVADHVPMDSYGKEAIPEYALRRRLPDMGAALAGPVVDYLERGRFDNPRLGMLLLRELGADVALPIVQRFLAPRDAPPAYESRIEAHRRRYLRGAAAGVLPELGRVGDEALAHALLFGDEPLSLKVDVVRALHGDDGAWAVPILVRLLRERDHGLRTDAILALEKRREPEAREALIADLFEHMERVHDRLNALVRRGDDAALAVMKRALADERGRMRKAGLDQFIRRRNPTLCRRGAALVRAYKPDLTKRQEIQSYLYALINVAPMDAVRFVDEHWDAFAKDDWRWTSLRMLREVTGKAAREAAVDLAIKRTPREGAPRPLALAAAAVFHGPSLTYDWGYRVEDVGAYFRTWLDSEEVFLQQEALDAWAHPKAPDAADRIIELLGRAREGKALPEDSSTHVYEQAFAERALLALITQPWEKVEATFVDVALAHMEDIDLALIAAYRLIGRIRAATRAKLSTWLGFDEEADPNAPGRHADRTLQLFLAAAVGTGADAATAARLQRVLARELWSYFDEKWLARIVAEGPSVLSDQLKIDERRKEQQRAYAFRTRVQALSRAVNSTRHEPSILATLSLVFDPRLAVFARQCVRREAPFLRTAGAGAAAAVPSDLSALGHMSFESWHWGMPLPIYQLLREAKVVDDATLATALEGVLARARADGTLARFPPLYLLRALESQLEPHTGRKPRTADVIWRYGAMLDDTDSPIDYWMRRKQATQLAEALRFREAADAQRHVTRILVRGNHTAGAPGFYERERAMQLALEGAAALVAETGGSEALLAAARAQDEHDPNVLNTVAWYRALAQAGLEEAEREARRATLLEARVENRPSVNAADTLAYVLLLRGKPRAGLAVLGPRMHERGALQNGLLHYHMAQLHAGAGRLRAAHDALVRALVWDRALEADIAGDAHLAPLLEKTTVEAIAKRAQHERFLAELP